MPTNEKQINVFCLNVKEISKLLNYTQMTMKNKVFNAKYLSQSDSHIPYFGCWEIAAHTSEHAARPLP